jgi:hypothetical protein
MASVRGLELIVEQVIGCLEVAGDQDSRDDSQHPFAASST